MTELGVSQRSETPLSDQILFDLFSIPPGVGDWLRGWERRLRLKREAIETVVASGPVVKVLGEVQSELDFLIESPLGQFQRLLRRPLTQLFFGEPARNGLDHAAGLILERSDKAIEANRAAAQCLTASEALSAEFDARAPNKLAALRIRHQVVPAKIPLLRRDVDGRAFLERLGKVREVMEAWVATAVGIPAATEIVDEKHITAIELAASHSHAMADRDKLRRIAGLGTSTRELLKAQIGDLASIALGGTTDSRTVGLESLLEASLHQVVNSADGGDREWDDASLWAIAALALSHRRLGEREEFTWKPTVWRTTDLRQTQEPLDRGTLRVIPLGDDITFISTNIDSAIRVWNAQVTIGADVECQVAPDDVPKIPPALCANDVRAMFGGFDSQYTHWYETSRRATMRIIASAPGGWYARIRRKGVLSVESRAPWMEPQSSASFLISLPAARQLGGEVSEEVAKLEPEPLATLFGLATYDAATGIAGHKRAWLRTTAGRWSGGGPALAREHELFKALDRTESGIAIKPVTAAILRGGRTPYPVYAIPTAFIAPDMMQLRKWVTTGSAALYYLLRAVASVVVAAHKQGFAVGVISLECFAFSATARAGSTYPVPTVVLAQAPLATRLGEPYAIPREPLDGEAINYPVLGLPLLSPAITDRAVAAEADDMFGFAAMLLDLLLGRAPNNAPTSWQDFVADTTFNWEIASRNSSLTRGVANAVRTKEGRQQLLAACRGMAAGSIVGLKALNDAV